MACKRPPETDVGKRLYELLQQASRGELKRTNVNKAKQILGHFEVAFISESAMVGSTRTLLRKAKQLPADLEEKDDD
jgi:hypothetical protein